METLQLEGRLSGPCVSELKSLADELLLHSAHLRLDLAELDSVDASGAGLLRELIARRVALLGCSGFVFELLRGSASAAAGSRLGVPIDAPAVERPLP